MSSYPRGLPSHHSAQVGIRGTAPRLWGGAFQRLSVGRRKKELSRPSPAYRPSVTTKVKGTMGDSNNSNVTVSSSKGGILSLHVTCGNKALVGSLVPREPPSHSTNIYGSPAPRDRSQGDRRGHRPSEPRLVKNKKWAGEGREGMGSPRPGAP